MVKEAGGAKDTVGNRGLGVLAQRFGDLGIFAAFDQAVGGKVEALQQLFEDPLIHEVSVFHEVAVQQALHQLLMGGFRLLRNLHTQAQREQRVDGIARRKVQRQLEPS